MLCFCYNLLMYHFFKVVWEASMLNVIMIIKKVRLPILKFSRKFTHCIAMIGLLFKLILAMTLWCCGRCVINRKKIHLKTSWTCLFHTPVIFIISCHWLQGNFVCGHEACLNDHMPSIHAYGSLRKWVWLFLPWQFL